jgi:hypothetical protein
MRNVVLAIASAFLFASGAAWSNDQAKTSSSTSKTDTSTATKSDTSGSKSEVTGKVQSADTQNHSLSLQSHDGAVQRVSVASDATVTRDGSQSSFSDIKEGDHVRASLDPSSNKATQLEVKSKSSKDSSKDSDSSKTK